ncbi:MAG TPA: phosphoribosylamine--glycine ligase [Burkholderiaceae bacterium]|nr:phosphoribosylamine--glycine ligase [Burkholderiaceae bacterium]
MKLLVVGSGGREHALAWRLALSPRVQRVYVAPGNGGTEREPNLKNVPIPVTDIGALADFAQSEAIAFTVVGPEAPLAAGIVDLFRQRGLEIFGPTKAAAQLESSKEFAKAFMSRHGIPTAGYRSFTDAADAHAWVDANGAPIVVKADGLASGKGVVVATTLDEAHRAIDMMLVDNRMGAAGSRVIVEEFLEGEEASFIVLCDGRNVLALASSQDHKRLLDGDRGPNTGGMGAYSPAPVVTPEVHARVMREVIQPTIAGMAADGIPYTGFLYAGLMIGADAQVRTLEFNCRMGDPETQPIIARVKSDLVDVFEHAIRGTLDRAEIDWDRRTALGVVLAAAGYPDQPRAGDPIAGIESGGNRPDADCLIFHAGTASDAEGRLVTSGGRVLCVTALGDSVKIAQSRAYAAAATIRFAGIQYRRDIGHRGLPAHARRNG